MKSDTLSFLSSSHSLDIPSETILEVEVVEEHIGEVHNFMLYISSKTNIIILSIEIKQLVYTNFSNNILGANANAMPKIL